jgi:hypothetical protein
MASGPAGVACPAAQYNRAAMSARDKAGTPREIDAEIDRLYQKPLDEFTAARNALAKQSGKRAPEIRGLAKPPVAAWAVNQLYWRRRPVYDALIDAAQQLRRAHAAVLAGRSADVRAAGKAHEERLATALDASLEILGESGHPVSDAIRQPIVTTLRALPAEETPGRLTRTLQPGGFEMLAGLSIGGLKAPKAPAGKTSPKPAAGSDLRKPEGARETKALARAREGLAAATRALKQVEHTAQREEFERSRAARDSDRATKAAAASRQAVEEAQDALRETEAAEAAALRKKEVAERRAQQAGQAVDTARSRFEAARIEVESLEKRARP